MAPAMSCNACLSLSITAAEIGTIPSSHISTTILKDNPADLGDQIENRSLNQPGRGTIQMLFPPRACFGSILTQTRPWWHHVNKPDSREPRYKSSTTGTADYPRAMTTVDDSCDGGQAANEPEARERSRCRGQPLSRHVVSRPAREQGPEGTLNRAAKRRWRGGAARGETKGEPRHRAAGRHTRQRTMHDGRERVRERNAHSGTPDTTPNERDADARPTTADAAVGH
ncbi:hypothetical protein B0H14DRAFT_3587243 [Mycena olivaceomarginata]|nr:hypothetical protein B0H14DRAFT_3587243 [Mycena olivaceomarginata]